MDKKKMNKLAIYSLIVFVIIMFLPIDVNYMTSILICLFASIGLLVCEIIALKQIKRNQEKGKTLAIISIVISILGIIMFGTNVLIISSLDDQNFVDSFVCPTIVTNCVKNEDGITSTCEFEEYKVKCSNEVLNEK